MLLLLVSYTELFASKYRVSKFPFRLFTSCFIYYFDEVSLSGNTEILFPVKRYSHSKGQVLYIFHYVVRILLQI